MTIEEKKEALIAFCNRQVVCGEHCPLYESDLKCGRGVYFDHNMSDEGINLAYSIAFKDGKVSMSSIMDSGNRTEFDSGAVRDIQTGKGRCDLMPLDVICTIYANEFGHDDPSCAVFTVLNRFMETGDHNWLCGAVSAFVLEEEAFSGFSDMFLEVAKHFEDGAKKYGENNWQKGIPVRSYIDSGIRHYLKFLRGDKDERHDLAFVWNMTCAIWTCIHKPELNEYVVGDKS